MTLLTCFSLLNRYQLFADCLSYFTSRLYCLSQKALVSDKLNVCNSKRFLVLNHSCLFYRMGRPQHRWELHVIILTFLCAILYDVSAWQIVCAANDAL